MAFKDSVAALITLCGGQARAADAVGVTQQAVSGWAQGAPAHPVMGAVVRQLLTDYAVRRRCFGHWMRGQCRAFGIGGGLDVMVEQWVVSETKASCVQRERITVARAARSATTDALAARWIGWSTGATGDYLVAWRSAGVPGGPTIVREVAYIDTEEVRPAYGRPDPLINGWV